MLHVVRYTPLNDPAHLTVINLQRLSAGEDIGEHPAEAADFVENIVLLEIAEQRVSDRASARRERTTALSVPMLDACPHPR